MTAADWTLESIGKSGDGLAQFGDTSALIWQRVRMLLRQRPLYVLAILLISVAILSGKFSFDRFVAETSRTSWLELRIWASAAVCAITFFLMLRGRLELPVLKKELWAALALLVLLHGYFIANALLMGDAIRKSEYVLDFSLLVLWAFLIVFYFRSQSELIIFSVIVEMTAIALFVLALAGFGNPELNGFGWAPFGGTITFYRMEFLAFCAGLYLSTVAASAYARGFHLMIAGVGLFSALASLSKAAFVSATCVTLFVAFNLLSVKQYRKAAGTVAIACAVFFIFFWIKGAFLLERVERAAIALSAAASVPAAPVVATQASAVAAPAPAVAAPSSSVAAPAPAVAAPSPIGSAPDPDLSPASWNLLNAYSTSLLEKVYSHRVTSVDDLTHEEQAQLRAIGQVFEGGGLPSYKTDLRGFLEAINRMVVLNDGSTRLQMGLAAWDDFMANKWFGIGIGNYAYKSFNGQAEAIDTYRYPHNIILEVPAATGLFGGAFFLLVIFCFQVLLQQRFLEGRLSIFFVGYGVFIFVSALFSGDLYDFRLYWYIGLLILVSSHSNHWFEGPNMGAKSGRKAR